MLGMNRRLEVIKIVIFFFFFTYSKCFRSRPLQIMLNL
jgi:hypothetical protein